MKKLLPLLLFLVSINTFSQILQERDRAELVDQILKDRFAHIVPNLMDRTGIDMWILISREYNEDPVLKTMLPSTWFGARRRTILVFSFDASRNKLEKLAISRYNVGDEFKSAWDPEKEPDQWDALMKVITDHAPNKIALDYSDDFGIADGIVKTDHDAFMANLPAQFKDKVVSAEELAVGWIETRTPMELQLYEELMSITHGIIKEAFSTKVIIPNRTTTQDVVWFMRQKVTDLGLDTWFQPSIDIQRSTADEAAHPISDDIIRPGDLLHCDFGITYLKLNTDCQEHAYVLKAGEKEVPEYLDMAFAKGNQVQDIFTGNFENGKTGNEILKLLLDEAKTQGLRPSIYTHPLGYYGHSAGATFGMWDQQDGVEGAGDYPMYPNTVYSIELNTTVNLPEWGKDIRIMLEEDAIWRTNGLKYINGRQKEIIAIGG
ncbi:MAG: Xaa-Pro aminopeptidase [Cytophagaceae bacterium]|nr:Xaa-Pro aminopeptidase [Cytophagaceae bacterium]